MDSRNDIRQEIRQGSGLDRRQFVVGLTSALAFGVLGALQGCAGDAAAAGGTAAGGGGGGTGATGGTGGTSGGGGAGTGGGSGTGAPSAAAPDTSPLVFVFYPDASSADMTASREAFADAIKAACGREVEVMLTTDYNVAIESIANGSADIAQMGAEGYIQANKKNGAVQAAWTNSDDNGSLELACYYSRICVRPEDLANYESGSGFTLEPLRDKSFSFVSASSTSGFKVPSSVIVGEFGLDSNEVLLEGGQFFSEVLFGNSHQGSVVNLVSGAAQAAAFDDIDVDMYLELVSGEANMPGALYRVRDDAEDPFTDVRGGEFVIISSTPVLNTPYVFNTETVDEATRTAIVEHMCSDAVADDPRIFKDPDDETAMAIHTKKTEATCFLPVTDSWYDPIRRLSS
ncbi:MAG: PhnD/SsuA/transferrin family substrate-binding protein [Coriobacteriales bacterium]|nr:PhnD/SsuA/transferrin family substrate-binding protein [Coriobacteriales bacterium]